LISCFRLYIMALYRVWQMEVNSEIAGTKTEKRVWGFWATVGWGILVMFISGVTQVAITVIFIIAKLVTEEEIALTELDYSEWLDTIDLGLLLSLSVVISAIVCVGLIFIIIKVRRNVTFADYLGFRSIGIGTVLVALAISVAYILLSVLVNMGLNRTTDSDIMVQAYASSVWPALFWVAVVVFGPFFEEVLFRGFLFEGFKQSRIGIVGTIIVTSLVWAGFHLQYGLFDIASIFILGVVLGIVRHKTGSLWAPMIMHAFNNLLAVFLIALEIGV
jgi:membrane protease YdiL (CAAX protease family)